MNTIKKAVVIAGHSVYFPGLAAILNGLHLYGSHLDVHWIYDDRPPEGEKALEFNTLVDAAGLQFPVCAVPISSLIERWPTIPRYGGWQFMTYRYKYLSSLAGEYDVGGILDADMLVLANLDPWFDIGAGSDYLITADHNYVAYTQIEQYDKEYAAHHWREGPLANFPLICDPAEWSDVLNTVWELAISFSEDAVDQVHFNRAIWECGKTSKVVVLSDCQWNREWMYRIPLVRIDRDLPRFFAGDTQIRIHTIHGRWWQSGYCQGEIQRTGEDTLLRENIDKLHDLFREMINRGPVQFKMEAA